MCYDADSAVTRGQMVDIKLVSFAVARPNAVGEKVSLSLSDRILMLDKCIADRIILSQGAVGCLENYKLRRNKK
jgi:hypothetical protein